MFVFCCFSYLWSMNLFSAIWIMLRDNRFGRFIPLFEASFLSSLSAALKFAKQPLRLLTLLLEIQFFPLCLPLSRKANVYSASGCFGVFYSIYKSFIILLSFIFIGFPYFSLRQGIVIPMLRYATFCFHALILLNTSVSGFLPGTTRLVIVVYTYTLMRWQHSQKNGFS